MKISDMLLPISIYSSSRGWQILIPHDDMKISDMLVPISINNPRLVVLAEKGGALPQKIS